MRSLALVLATLTAASTVASGAAAATPKATLVVARAPLGRTVQDLMKGKFAQVVVCKKSCAMTTSVVIRPSVAKQLGFKPPAGGDWIEIGTAKARLSSSASRKVAVHLNTKAKGLLARAGPVLKAHGLQILGRVEATTTKGPSQRGAAAWIVTVAWR